MKKLRFHKTIVIDFTRSEEYEELFKKLRRIAKREGGSIEDIVSFILFKYFKEGNE